METITRVDHYHAKFKQDYWIIFSYYWRNMLGYRWNHFTILISTLRAKSQLACNHTFTTSRHASVNHTIFLKDRTQIISVWKNKQVAISLLIFGLFGMLAVQYTYMASIHYGNAAVATLLQYLAPVMIIIYLLIRKQTALSKQDILTVALALIGCFFLLTNGSLSELSVPVPAYKHFIYGIKQTKNRVT